MGTRFATSNDAVRHLLDALLDILSDGYDIRGIDPKSVEIASRSVVENGNFVAKFDPPATPSPALAKRPVAPYDAEPVFDAKAAGFHGDVSSCCGAPLKSSGACHVCTGCGSSTGCG